MADLPSGTVTFLFTDIEGSTKLLQQLGDGYEAAISEHRKLLREAFAAHNGHEMGTEGDSFAIAFAKASDGVGAALAGQLSLTSREWDHEPIRVRMGVHTGEVQMKDGDYFGLAVHQAARVGAAAHGGQVLVSQTTRDLVAGTLPGDAQLVDLGEHRLKDITEPIRLFNLTHPGLQAAFLPPRTLSVLPNNLPVQLTSFVGRDTEVADVRKLLDSGRLVTLTGAGGSGKTRLALEVAAEILDECRDGVWFIDLAPVIDEDFVPQVTARTLGLAEPSGQAITEEGAARAYIDRIVAHLSSKDLVLVLDNCEHLIAACAALGEQILRSCPDVRVIATAREPLGIGGENVYRVPSLDLPEPDDSLDGLLACDSIRLFCERAGHVKTGFALSADNATAVAKICRDLDGLPLGIELGAALVKALSPAQIAKRLGDRFELLRGGSRTALERQQTLRAAVDWSYELLSEDERTLFRRLSVFVGGFSLEGAEALCSDDGGVPASEVLHTLAQLVDRSMVQVYERGDETRYSLLETMRQYGREKLIDSGEGPELRDRHLAWYTTFALEAGPKLHTADQLEWLQRTDAEIDNIRAALEWASSDGSKAIVALHATVELDWYWHTRSLRAEASTWLETLLSVATEAPSAIAARANLCLALFTPDLRNHLRYSDAAIVAARVAGDDRTLGRALCLKSMGIRDDAEALALLDEGERLARETRDELGLLWAFAWGYQRRRNAGDTEGANAAAEALRALLLEIEERVSIGWAFGMLSGELRRSGEYREALDYTRRAIEIFREIDDRPFTALNMAVTGQLESIFGNNELANQLVEAAVTLIRETGDIERIPAVLTQAGVVKLRLGDLSAAREVLGEAHDLFRTQGRFDFVAIPLLSLAQCDLREGAIDAATAHAKEALEHLPNERLREALAHLCLAGAALGRNNVHVAREHVRKARAALDGATTFEAASTLESLAVLLVAEERFAEAARALGAAADLRERIGCPVFLVDEESLKATVSSAQNALGASFPQEFEAGRALSLDEALALLDA